MGKDAYSRNIYCAICKLKFKVEVPKDFFLTSDENDILIATDKDTEKQQIYYQCPKCGLKKYLQLITY